MFDWGTIRRIPHTNSIKWPIPNAIGITDLSLFDALYSLSPLWSRRLNLITFAGGCQTQSSAYTYILYWSDVIQFVALRITLIRRFHKGRLLLHRDSINESQDLFFFRFRLPSGLILSVLLPLSVLLIATRMIVRSYRQWECASKVWKISLITLLLHTNHCRKILQKQCLPADDYCWKT